MIFLFFFKDVSNKLDGIKRFTQQLAANNS